MVCMHPAITENAYHHFVVPWQGFKIIGDNIDKTIRPSFERIEHHSLSLHYYHSYAALDRIDLSGISDMRSSGTFDAKQLLPSTNDVQMLKSQYYILISRYIIIHKTCITCNVLEF